MTPAGFRRIALGLDGVEERAHHGHPDFRVNKRIFATLGYPDRKWGMVVLARVQQRAFVRDHPEAFAPVKGAWGEQGCTNVRLDAVDEETLGEALTIAWQNAVGRRTAARAARKSVRKIGRRTAAPARPATHSTRASRRKP